jgi:hypothetical protein
MFIPDTTGEMVLAALFWSGSLTIYLAPLVMLGIRPESKWARLSALCLIILSLATLGCAAFVLDDALLAPHSVRFCVQLIFLAAIITVPVSIRYHSKAGLVLTLAFCVALVTLQLGDFLKTKAYKEFYAQIQPGMNEPQVQAAVQRGYTDGKLPRPAYCKLSNSSSESDLILQDSTGSISAARIDITFSNGQVVKKEYSDADAGMLDNTSMLKSSFQLVLGGLPLVIFLAPLVMLLARPDRRWTFPLAVCLILPSFIVLGVVAVALDFFMTAPFSLLFSAMFIALACAVALPISLRLHSKTGFVLILVFSATMVLFGLSDSNEKSFKRAYANIRPGLTQSEVQAVMQREFASSRYLKPEFRPPAVGDDRAEFLLSESPGRDYDAFIFVTFKNGLVTDKEYSPD